MITRYFLFIIFTTYLTGCNSSNNILQESKEAIVDIKNGNYSFMYNFRSTISKNDSLRLIKLTSYLKTININEDLLFRIEYKGGNLSFCEVMNKNISTEESICTFRFLTTYSPNQGLLRGFKYNGLPFNKLLQDSFFQKNDSIFDGFRKSLFPR